MIRIENFDELKEGMIVKEKINDLFIDLFIGLKIDCGGSGSGFETFIKTENDLILTSPITMWKVNNYEVQLFIK